MSLGGYRNETQMKYENDRLKKALAQRYAELPFNLFFLGPPFLFHSPPQGEYYLQEIPVA